MADTCADKGGQASFLSLLTSWSLTNLPEFNNKDGLAGPLHWDWLNPWPFHYSLALLVCLRSRSPNSFPPSRETDSLYWPDFIGRLGIPDHYRFKCPGLSLTRAPLADRFAFFNSRMKLLYSKIRTNHWTPEQEIESLECSVPRAVRTYFQAEDTGSIPVWDMWWNRDLGIMTKPSGNVVLCRTGPLSQKSK